MDRIIQSPGKYIQGADVITRLGEYLKPLAERWLVVGDKFVLGFAQGELEKVLKMQDWRWKLRRLAVNARKTRSTVCAAWRKTHGVVPCSASAAVKRWIPPKPLPTL